MQVEVLAFRVFEHFLRWTGANEVLGSVLYRMTGIPIDPTMQAHFVTVVKKRSNDVDEVRTCC